MSVIRCNECGRIIVYWGGDTVHCWWCDKEYPYSEQQQVMSCLDIQTKLAMMIDAIQTGKRMLKADDIRPHNKLRIEEELRTLQKDIRKVYIDFFKIIANQGINN